MNENQKTPVQGGATKEQIESAIENHGVFTYNLDYGDGYFFTRDALDELIDTISVSVSADPADQHHDAEERQAESEDHAATVTGEVNALIDSLDEHVTHEDIARALTEFRDGPLAAALAAPVEVDEAKLAEVIWGEQESRVLDGYVVHTRETARTTAAAVIAHLRGEGQ